MPGPEVTIPTIEPQTAADRAGNAFDAAVSSLIEANFREAPRPQEIERLGHMAQDADGDLVAALESFSQRFPDSVISYYYSFTQGTDFILSRGSLRFDQQALARDVRRVLSGIRQQVVEQVRTLADPEHEERAFTIDTTDFDRDLVMQLQRLLTEQFSAPGTSIPITVRTTPGGRMELVTQVQAAQREFTEEQMQQRGGGK